MKNSCRNDLYLQWIKTKPCLASKRPAEVAHHVRLNDNTSGTGLRPSDYRTIPLTHFFHTISSASVHRLGEERFYARYAIDPQKQIINYLHEYLRECFCLSICLPQTERVEDSIVFLEKLIEERRDNVAEEKKMQRYNEVLNEQRRKQYQKIKGLTQTRAQALKELAKEYRQARRKELKNSATDKSFKEDLKRRARQFRKDTYRRLKQQRKELFKNEKKQSDEVNSSAN